MALEGSSRVVNTCPNPSPGRRSTQAPKISPLPMEMNLSQGSAWIPRVTPRLALKLMLFCTGWKSGRPSSVILARCQFSLNQPRLSPCTGRSKTKSPGMLVLLTFSSFSKSKDMVTTQSLSSGIGNRSSERNQSHTDRRRRQPPPPTGSGPRHCPLRRYFSSVAALAGSHQARLFLYQSMVCSRPLSKSVCAGSHPSSVRSLVASIA